MLTRYRRRFYHDRRRIAFATVLTVGSGVFAQGLLPDPLPIATEVIVVAGFLMTVPLFTARFRTKRHWVELTALANLIVTASGHLWPAGFFGWHDIAFMLTLQIPAYVALVAGLSLLIYGQWSEDHLPRREYLVRTKLRSTLPVQDLWYGLVPTPGFIDHYPDREVVSIEFADASRKNVRLTTWTPPRAGTGEILIRIDRVEPLRYARFALNVLRGARDPDGEGETELMFEDRGADRVVHLRHRVDSYSPRRAILGYFDDTYGRMMSARLDAIEARVRSGRVTKAETDVAAWFENHTRFEDVPDDRNGGYHTAYGRRRTDDETRVLRALGRI